MRCVGAVESTSPNLMEYWKRCQVPLLRFGQPDGFLLVSAINSPASRCGEVEGRSPLATIILAAQSDTTTGT